MLKGKKRYSAVLFFQYRVRVNNADNSRRVCEKRIITFTSKDPKDAYSHAHRRGESSKYSYLNEDGNRVFYEFVGVADLIELGIECEGDEVWYEITEYLTPMERKRSLIPSKHKLIETAVGRKKKRKG